MYKHMCTPLTPQNTYYTCMFTPHGIARLHKHTWVWMLTQSMWPMITSWYVLAQLFSGHASVKYSHNVSRLMGIHLFISIKLHYAVILALCQYEHLADQNWE